MRTIKIILFLILIISPAYSQNAWVAKYSIPNNVNFFDACFLNANTAWVVGGNSYAQQPCLILKTTNGGNNWITQTISMTDVTPTAIAFINENTGWMTVSPLGSGGSDWYSFLFYTENGGDFWYEVPTTSLGVMVNSIYPVSPTNIFFASGVGYFWGFGYTYIGGIVKTTNVGLNHSMYLFNDSSDCKFEDIQFAGENTGWAYYSRYSNSGYALAKTTNQGANWFALSFDNIMYMNRIRGFQFVNQNTGYASITVPNGAERFKKTTDGGTAWFDIQIPPTVPFVRSFNFLNAETGWAEGGNANISKTTNGGMNWISSDFSASTVYPEKIKFIDSMTGWMFTLREVYRTTTGGITFINENGAQTVKKFSLSQNYPNPFNPTTTINYELPITNFVSLKVYDALGNEVQTLVNEKQNAGSYSVDFNAVSLPSGIYFYKLVTEKFSETRKMILIK